MGWGEKNSWAQAEENQGNTEWNFKKRYTMSKYV